MASHGPGKGNVYCGTSIPRSVYVELTRRATAGGWRSTGAYIRAILEHHVANSQAIAERRVLYTIEETTPARAAESKEPYRDKK
jgi:hypothetical protein